MFWTPLEPRIKAAVVAGWFNHRRNKLVIADKRYSCFLETKEEHAFFDGWLTTFTDSDVASLICPRPLLIQTGKKDGIAWWPMVIEEFEAAKEHYARLGLADRIELDLRDGGHEAHVESGMGFLSKWLKRNLKPPKNEQTSANKRAQHAGFLRTHCGTSHPLDGIDRYFFLDYKSRYGWLDCVVQSANGSRGTLASARPRLVEIAAAGSRRPTVICVR